MNSSNCRFNFLNLPDDVWSEVLSYLPVVDRKCVRLSCSRFYQISSGVDSQKTEKIVFRGNLNSVLALQSFASSERRIWNLELNTVHLMDPSILSFFQLQGPKIRSLTFNDCAMAPGVFKSIIVCCENLCSLALSFSYFSDYSQLSLEANRLDSLVIFSDIEVLRDAGIIRKNVSNFSLNLSKLLRCQDYYLTNKKFLDLFAVFPNIKKLDLLFGFHFFVDDSNPLSFDLTSDIKFSFSSIYHQLYKMRHQLEKLTLLFSTINYRHSLLIFNNISRIEMNNLKTLSIDYTHYGISSVIGISQLQYLTDIRCIIKRDVCASLIIQRILLAAKHLHSLNLNIETRSNLDLDKDCFFLLVKSQLRNLSIDTRSFVRINFEYSSLENCLLPNYVLNYLDLSVDNCNIIPVFTKYFQNLKTLNVKNVDDSLIYTIFSYQTKLQNLSVNNEKEISSASLKHWLSNTNLLNHQLDNLSHLCIIDYDSFHLTEFLLNKFAFPKLESLYISLRRFCQKKNISLFWRGILKCTNLEYLKIQWETALSYSHWLVLCKTLPKLRYVLIFKPFSLPLKDSEYRQLFQVCPSLCVLFHGHCDYPSRTVQYFKDIIKNTVGKIENVSISRQAHNRSQIFQCLYVIPPKYYHKPHYWS